MVRSAATPRVSNHGGSGLVAKGRLFFCALPRRGKTLMVAGAGRRDRQAAVGIFVELVAQRADRDAQDIGGVGAIAQAMFQRLQDQIALDVGHRAADQRAGDLLGGKGGVGDGGNGLGEVETIAIRER